ncbi:MAG: SDR family oxidoreductase [Lacrimispora sp.]|uniref:SDR family NAD(P)-dependent oxidoreductase n=1 Tax=Lacrimispora sp. TaxID=2719234 RepID=UPI0039E3838C
MRLKDKVAIITGGASGIGRASAERFAKEGARVVVADMNRQNGLDTVAGIKAEGGEASFFEVDVADVSQVKAMIDFAVEAYGRLDILFNNAGYPCAAGMDVEEEDYDKGMDINLKGGFFAVKYALPEFQKQGGGSVIFTASVGGMVASTNSPLYGAAKGAVVNLTRSLAVKYAKENIRVNCLCPGPTDTAMLPLFTSRPGDELSQEDSMKVIMNSTPMGRVAPSSELANAVLFLASDEAAFVTGVILPVDGGYVAR